MSDELIRVWRCDGFSLRLWDTFRVDRYGKSILAYELRDKGRVIFRGADFHASPMHAIDSDETVAGILAFLTLQPGDADADYFADYTPEQLAWCKSSRCELLASIRSEMEEA